MGAIAEAFVAYAQPLIDQTDGSQEQLDRALEISQLCYNLALMSDDDRASILDETQQSLGMDDAEFVDFRRSVIDPMIRRHEEMFPGLRHLHFGGAAPFGGAATSPAPPQQAPAKKPKPGDLYPGAGRYAPCPCGSGEKYKFCCGKKGR